MVTAKGKASTIIRANPDGSTKQIPIDVTKVLKGEVPDAVLAQNDVVFIPGSTTKTIARGLLSSIGGVLTTLVYVASGR